MAYDGKYDIGERPTDEEWAIYRHVFTYDQRENVALWLEANRPGATQGQFERMCEVYAENWKNDGEHDWEMLRDAYEDATREVRA